MTVKYQTDTSGIILNKETVTENFFALSTGLAGEILQKYINYGMKIAIYGDFSSYTSKSLRIGFEIEKQGRQSGFWMACPDSRFH